MGIEKNKVHEKAAKRSKRGSTNNKSRLDAFNQVNSARGADWGGCSPEKLQGIIMAITELGGAITIGLSRDKGAYSMTLLLDGGRTTLWFNGNADLDAELDDVAGTLAALS